MKAKIVEQFLKDNILDGNVKVKANIPGVTKSYMLLSDILKKFITHLYPAGEEVYVRCELNEAEAKAHPMRGGYQGHGTFWLKKLTRPTVTEGEIEEAVRAPVTNIVDGMENHRSPTDVEFTARKEISKAIKELLNR